MFRQIKQHHSQSANFEGHITSLKSRTGSYNFDSDRGTAGPVERMVARFVLARDLFILQLGVVSSYEIYGRKRQISL